LPSRPKWIDLACWNSQLRLDLVSDRAISMDPPTEQYDEKPLAQLKWPMLFGFRPVPGLVDLERNHVMAPQTRDPWLDRACPDAARAGDLAALRAAREADAPWNEAAAEAAAGGHFGALQWCHANGCSLGHAVCNFAAERGDLAMLQWARSVGAPWSSVTCRMAAAGGHLAALQWLRAAAPGTKRLTPRRPQQGTRMSWSGSSQMGAPCSTRTFPDTARPKSNR
jgi:hypothetical protein